MTGAPHSLRSSKEEDHERESHKGRLPLPRCGHVAFCSEGGGPGRGVVPFSALVSLFGERQDKDGKGERIRAEALVV